MNPFKDDIETNSTITNTENSDKKEDKILDHTIVDDSPQVTGIEASNTTREGGAANQSSDKETIQAETVSSIEASNSLVEKGDNQTLIQNRDANNNSLALAKANDLIKKEGKGKMKLLPIPFYKRKKQLLILPRQLLN